MNDLPIRRSELTCPGHSAAMMAKAAASQADEVIFDLEDACAPSQKVAARKTVAESLATLDFGNKIRAFRVNGCETPLFYRDVIDVVEAARGKVDVVVLPKVDSAEDIRFADRLLSQIEVAIGLPPGRIGLEALIESAKGLLAAGDIARASPRLKSLIFGIADYAGDLGLRDFSGDSSIRFHHAKSQILVAARAAGIDAIDHVTVQYKDLDQCRRDAESSLAMGYSGKWAIHPAQVEVINRAFSPTGEQIARARRIVAAYDAAHAEGEGAIAVEGEMIDAATLRVERRVLAVANRS